MARRRYTDEERANALAALAANDGNVKRTARELGIPAATLKHWIALQGANHHPQKKQDMADALEEIAWKIIPLIKDKLKEATLPQLSTTIGIVIDKMRLLRGESTEINEQLVHDKLAALRERYAADAAADPRTDALPQSVPDPKPHDAPAPVPRTGGA